MAKRIEHFRTILSQHADDVAALRAMEPVHSAACTDAELVAFLMASDMHTQKAAEKLRVAKDTVASFGTLTIADCAPFLRAPSAERRLPDGAVAVLEDDKGGVARDRLGRPIMVAIGMQHGNAAEMQKQMMYCAQRARAHVLPGMPPNAMCVVIDVQPQEKQAPPTFRFPDRDVRTLFELQERCFPGNLMSSTHFCGLPMAVCERAIERAGEAPRG